MWQFNRLRYFEVIKVWIRCWYVHVFCPIPDGSEEAETVILGDSVVCRWRSALELGRLQQMIRCRRWDWRVERLLQMFGCKVARSLRSLKMCLVFFYPFNRRKPWIRHVGKRHWLCFCLMFCTAQSLSQNGISHGRPDRHLLVAETRCVGLFVQPLVSTSTVCCPPFSLW